MPESGVSVQDFINVAESFWPLQVAEAWDTPGLQIGSRNQAVSRVLCAVDVNQNIVDEALKVNADLIFTHHPFLMRGISSVDESDEKGSVIAGCIRAGISVYSAHTNADAAPGGVSDVLASALGLTRVTPIVPVPRPEDSAGFSSTPGIATSPNLWGIGRVGILESPTTLSTFTHRVAEILPSTATGIRVSGDPSQVVQVVALCAGAGDSLLKNPVVYEADVYVTSDLRHHPALDAADRRSLNRGPALVDVSHWASESLWLDSAISLLANSLTSVEFVRSSESTDPWDFVVYENRTEKP